VGGKSVQRQDNINAIDGDLNGDGKGDTQLIPLPVGVDAIQKAYVRKVIDTLSDLENVLFEISNESEYRSLAWQSQLINYIKDYQSERVDGIRRKQHPVGITAFIDQENASMSRIAADWISPGAVSFDRAGEAYIATYRAHTRKKSVFWIQIIYSFR
jgi:hypothetical protein